MLSYLSLAALRRPSCSYVVTRSRPYLNAQPIGQHVVLSLPPKLRQQLWRRAGLRADEGGDVDGALMEAGQVFAAE